MTGSPAHLHPAESSSIDDHTIAAHIKQLSAALASTVPMGNEEVDMQGGWSKTLAWHTDAWNAAGLLRILAMHEDMLNSNKTLRASYGYHANDNAVSTTQAIYNYL